MRKLKRRALFALGLEIVALEALQGAPGVDKTAAFAVRGGMRSAVRIPRRPVVTPSLAP
jgi:hypothetical protein